jgi:hypothetical protein
VIFQPCQTLQKEYNKRMMIRTQLLIIKGEIIPNDRKYSAEPITNKKKNRKKRKEKNR